MRLGPEEKALEPTLTWNLEMDLWKTIFLYYTQWFAGSMLVC